MSGTEIAIVRAEANLAERARAFAATYLIRLDSNPNDPGPAEKAFDELRDAAMELAGTKGWRFVG